MSAFPTSAFDYSCPRNLIAQRPLSDRAASRLLVLDRETGEIAHRTFRDFPALLAPGDVLVRNTSRVIPARLKGRRDNGREAEILLVHPEPDGSWLAMVHPGGKLKVGRSVWFGDDGAAEIVDVVGGGLRRLRFTGADVTALMERHGTVPLPPYIERPAQPEDRERYQTVYARVDGSVAAPTAGFHFTPEILQRIATQGVQVVDVVLHVGPGTFKPVEVDDPAHHTMHAEWYELPVATAEAVNAAKRAGTRVWAVGTTAARTLETLAQPSPPGPLSRTRERGDEQAVSGWDEQTVSGRDEQTVSGRDEQTVSGRDEQTVSGRDEQAVSGWTDLFIYPPYEFKIVDALLTNFHLPRSTLIMLVAAFAGYERTMRAYREAVEERYRLYSYGDAMAIV